jgi:hypothetical protein
MSALNAVPPRDRRAEIIQRIEEVGRRCETRSASFEFASAELAARAAESLTAGGVHAFVAYWGSGRYVLVSFRAPDVERTVEAALAAGGTYYAHDARDGGRHDNPIADDDRYVPPQGFSARMEHVAKLREELESISFKIDYSVSREGAWQVRIGKMTVPIANPPENVDEELGEIAEIERFARLTRRLLEVLR